MSVVTISSESFDKYKAQEAEIEELKQAAIEFLTYTNSTLARQTLEEKVRSK